MPSPDSPGLEPPWGVIPDFASPYTLQPYQALTVAACVIVTTVMVAARIYTKAYIVKALKWEDYTCVFGWVTFMVFLGLEFSIGKHGGGTHQWNVVYTDVQYNKRYSNYGDIIYSWSLFFTKYSILLLILRIFCSVERDACYWLTQALAIVNGVFYTLFFFIPIFLCTPRSKIWAPDEPGHCMKIEDLYLASASFNTISDIAMLSVPIFLIFNLRLSVRRKIGVSAIFCTGGLACISSILRLIYIVFLTRTKDYTYVKLETALWAMAELACGLLCGCFVILPRLYQHISNIAPYKSGRETERRGPGDPTDKTRPSGDPKGNWVQLKEGRTPSLLPEAHKKCRKDSDDHAFEVAVAGIDRDVENRV